MHEICHNQYAHFTINMKWLMHLRHMFGALLSFCKRSSYLLINNAVENRWQLYKSFAEIAEYIAINFLLLWAFGACIVYRTIYNIRLPAAARSNNELHKAAMKLASIELYCVNNTCVSIMSPKGSPPTFAPNSVWVFVFFREEKKRKHIIKVLFFN